LNDSTGRVEPVGGIKYTIKDGIVYDAKKLLEGRGRDGGQTETRRSRAARRVGGPREDILTEWHGYRYETNSDGGGTGRVVHGAAPGRRHDQSHEQPAR
jgi:hypothetical protein